MRTAEEVFKAAWAKRDAEWEETFEDMTGYGQFAPTEPSLRVQAGLEALSAEIAMRAVQSNWGGFEGDEAGIYAVAIMHVFTWLDGYVTEEDKENAPA